MMLPLTDVIAQAGPQYMKYLGKKTSFLPGSTDDLENAQFIWLQMIRSYDFEKQISALNEDEYAAFIALLESYCFQQNNVHARDLEEKIPWIFRHPGGGIFIPIEIVKKLMLEQRLQKRHFLFTLLYQLKLKELHGLASMVTTKSEAQAAISFESHVLDMALVMYIWFASFLRNNAAPAFTKKGKVIDLATRLALNSEQTESVYPLSARPMWPHLNEFFPDQHTNIADLKKLITAGKKGFYRAMTILPVSNTLMYDLFQSGWLIPVFPAGKLSERADEIQIATPFEARQKVSKV